MCGSAFMALLISAFVLAYATDLSNKFFGDSVFTRDALSTVFWLWLGWLWTLRT
jgi:hypothetical protein